MKKADLIKEVTLVNYKTHQGRNGTGFNADIKYEGKKIAHVRDDARGGCFHYDNLGELKQDGNGEWYQTPEFIENKKLIKELEGKAEKVYTEFSFEQLDSLINDVVNVIETEKIKKKIKNACKSKIVFGTVDAYKEFAWKGIKTLTQLVAINGGLNALQKAYNEATDTLEKGDVVHNDPKSLKDLGININDKFHA